MLSKKHLERYIKFYVCKHIIKVLIRQKFLKPPIMLQ